jgi:hypothetical protein
MLTEGHPWAALDAAGFSGPGRMYMRTEVMMTMMMVDGGGDDDDGDVMVVVEMVEVEVEVVFVETVTAIMRP